MPPERTAPAAAGGSRVTPGPRGPRRAAGCVLRTPGCLLRRVHRPPRCGSRADGLEPSFLLGGSFPSRGALLLPHTKHPVLDKPHVARRRLQQCQFVHEGAFECGLAHVHGPAAARVVVVGVSAVPPLRPTARQRASAGFTAYEAAQRKVRWFRWRGVATGTRTSSTACAR